MKRILLVGLVRNVAKTLRTEVLEKKRLFENLAPVDVYLVESDSIDGTQEILEQLSVEDSNIEYRCLGNLAIYIPNRIERLRFCRNVYVNYVRKFPVNTWEYVVVLDWDGINSRLSLEGIQDAFSKKRDWDACFPVQSRGYYDLLALREKTWMPVNPFLKIRDDISLLKLHAKTDALIFKILREYKIERIRKRELYDKMKIFRRQSELINVESAFGGMGIYQSEIFHSVNYDVFGYQEECEHVDFHKRAISQGYRLCINPKMINSGWNSYNINRFLFIRLYRKLGLRLNFFALIYKLKNRYNQ